MTRRLKLIALACLSSVGCVSGAVSRDAGPSGAGGAAAPGVGGSGAGGSSAGSGGAHGGVGGSPGGVGGTPGGAGGNGAGGATAGTAGATGTGAGGAGGATAGCPGVPLTPDAGGFIAPTSNAIGVRGSWFVYSDCVDLKGVNCSMVESPTAASSFPNVGGRMCTSGQTSANTAAWGAGIGLELNDGPPQMPYDTVAHGVKGFCFQLSGTTIPSTSIRVAFPTKNNPDNAYFSAVTTPGQHTVLFTDTAQGSWVTTKTPFDPTTVMLLQLQIPASPGVAVPWDFCIEGLTAITQ